MFCFAVVVSFSANLEIIESKALFQVNSEYLLHNYIIIIYIFLLKGALIIVLLSRGADRTIKNKGTKQYYVNCALTLYTFKKF